jgi:hypothetical protein
VLKKINSQIGFFFLLIVLITGACDLFQVSLVDYLKNEDLIDEANGPWVYVAVNSGNDASSGLSRGNAVKTLGKALDIWAAEGSGSAKIMLLEDVVHPAYNESTALIRKGLIDFSELLASRSGITSITLSGPQGRKAVCSGENGGWAVLFINTPGITMTLKNLIITGGGGWSGGGIYIGGGASVIMENGVIIEGNGALQGGGVYVDGIGSRFTMAGGEIRGNKALSMLFGRGGGVCVENNGTFVMEGGIIRNNDTNNRGGGVAVDGINAAMIFRGGTVAANSGKNLGGGILVTKGRLDMQGGRVSGNTAIRGPGIVIEKEGELVMSKFARVLDAANPILLSGTSPAGWITIGSGGFSGNYGAENIAIVTTNGPYGQGTEVLKMETGGSAAAYCGYFNVDGKGFGSSVDSNGKLK